MPDGSLRTLQRQAYEAVWLCPSYDKRPAPLKILSFTSESYEAIKERERKKAFRRHRSDADQTGDDPRQDHEEHTQFELLMDTPSTSVGTVDCTYSVECHDLQMALPICHNSSITQPCGELQHELDTLGTQRAIVFEEPVILTDRSPSPSSSPLAIGLNSGESSGVEPQHHTLRHPSATQDISSADGSRLIVPDDSGLLERSDHGQILNEVDLAATPSCPQSLVRLTGSYKRISQGEMALGDNRAHMIGRNISTRIIVSKEKCISQSHVYWTTEQDEKLLHVRDVSQLRWANVFAYFPGIAPSAVKRRYKQLRAAEKVPQTPCYQPQAREENPMVHDQHFGSPKWKVRGPYQAQPGMVTDGPSDSARTKHHNAKRRGGTRIPVDRRENEMSPALPKHEVASRTSRSGRPILHPFRHRPSEGYV